MNTLLDERRTGDVVEQLYAVDVVLDGDALRPTFLVYGDSLGEDDEEAWTTTDWDAVQPSTLEEAADYLWYPLLEA